MDKALVYGTRDSGFDPQRSRILICTLYFFFINKFIRGRLSSRILICTLYFFFINKFIQERLSSRILICTLYFCFRNKFIKGRLTNRKTTTCNNTFIPMDGLIIISTS
jgi:hypothetical protein